MVEINREITASPENRPLQGVAAALALPDGRLYTIEETTNRPEYGKMAGMRTIPMETVKDGERHEETLERLIQEELGESAVGITMVERIGIYGIGIAGATLFVGSCQLLSEDATPPDGDVVNPLWLHPQEILNYWVRQGVKEMVEDIINKKRNVIRETVPVLPEQNPGPQNVFIK